MLDRVEPFDSERKWSAASFVDHGWFYLGAPDFLLAPDEPMRELVERLSAGGKRLLAVCSNGALAACGRQVLLTLSVKASGSRDGDARKVAVASVGFGAMDVTLQSGH